MMFSLRQLLISGVKGCRGDWGCVRSHEGELFFDAAIDYAWVDDEAGDDLGMILSIEGFIEV